MKVTESENQRDDSLAGLFLRATHLYVSKAYRQTADAGVHPRQIPMLKFLERNPGCNQREIASCLHIKPPTVNVALKRMEKSGFIRKEVDKKDQRIIRIYLSDKGVEISRNLEVFIKDSEKYLNRGFTEAETQLFKRFLKQLNQNLLEEDQEETKEEENKTMKRNEERV